MQILFRKTRIGQQPSSPVPFALRTFAHGNLAAGQKHCFPNQNFGRFIFSRNGNGMVFQNGSWQKLSDNECAVWLPNSGIQQIQAHKEDWQVGWWVCDGRQLNDIMLQLGFNNTGRWPVDIIPAGLWKEVKNCLSSPTLAEEFTNSLVTYRLLISLAGADCRKPSGIITKAMKYITKNLGNPEFTVGALAKHLHINRFSLSRIFKKYYRKPPAQYIQEQRINKALETLLDTDKPVSEIGGECGYPDPAHFSRVFRKTTGLSPRQAREGGLL